MRYTLPVWITVEVDSPENVLAAAKAEEQRKFSITDEQWQSVRRPSGDQQVGHALGVLMTSDAVTGAVTGILERTVLGLAVTGFHVATSEVVGDDEGDG